MITRCFDQGEDATVKTKQCGPKLFGSQARFVCEAKCAGNHTRDSRALTVECEKGAADRADYRSRWSDCQLTADTLRLQ